MRLPCDVLAYEWPVMGRWWAACTVTMCKFVITPWYFVWMVWMHCMGARTLQCAPFLVCMSCNGLRTLHGLHGLRTQQCAPFFSARELQAAVPHTFAHLACPPPPPAPPPTACMEGHVLRVSMQFTLQAVRTCTVQFQFAGSRSCGYLLF